MLISMTYHIGLILIIVMSLTSAQFVVDYLQDTHAAPPKSFDHANIPLLRTPSDLDHASSLYDDSSTAQPRTKARPDQLFLHPNNSNIARAESFALELGLGGEANGRAQAIGGGYSAGNGEARQNGNDAHGHRRSPSSKFQIGDEEEGP